MGNLGNIMALLPLLMGMKNGGNGNLADMMSAFSKSGGFGDNPMLSLIMNMMTKPPQKSENKEVFEAIKNLSGSEVTEALKLLLNR